MYTNSAMREAIDECIHNELHRTILRRRMIDGWTYERIAEEAERTPRQIITIVEQHRRELLDFTKTSR